MAAEILKRWLVTGDRGGFRGGAQLGETCRMSAAIRDSYDEALDDAKAELALMERDLKFLAAVRETLRSRTDTTRNDVPPSHSE